ncbi:hypothetical protein F0919_06880 [Taibaiella lutea]|uniref:Uncharacterized protein n=1 Tax=Taibaiella lutea TaxID=2608001 RepID=A0A5M6CQF5_9BACT|nr:DUF2683 family protein [Taibaiella lutea]KAA5537394.1 hypothetical protein F0919_06880 [Taibaiella lutea]
METILAHPENQEQLEAIKAFLKALKIKFESKKEEKPNYDPEFVKMLLEGKKQIEEGRGVKISLEDLWK